MKRARKVLSVFMVISILVLAFSALSNLPMVTAAAPEQQVLDSSYQWRYLDDNTDPNVGTFYEQWNIRCGWTFPLGFKAYGVVDMNFKDTTWKDGVGPFSFDSANGGTVLQKTAGKPNPTYFLRATFNVPDVKEIVAIAGKIKYNDAAILYINGKPIEDSFNIPMSNYPSNLTYGCEQKLGEKYKEATFLIEDVSMLLKGTNVLGVELHTSDAADTDVYFELESLVLNPQASNLPEVEKIKTVSVTNGADESQMNFAWYSLSEKQGSLQIADKADMMGDLFPVDKAKTYNATKNAEAYTKFYDKKYYYNQAAVSGLERGKSYVYRVGSSDGWSEPYILKTQDISEKQEVLFVSDAQIGTGTMTTDRFGWQNTLNKAFEKYPNISFIANPGDVVDTATKESEYDRYFSPPQLKGVPSATAAGNHDVAANFGYHHNLVNQSGLGGNAAHSDYSFTYGNVLYMVLNTNNTNNAQHAKFIEDTVASYGDREFDWKIVIFHQSLYSAATQSIIDMNISRRNALVPVMDANGIDVVLMGHDHCYVRSKHMKNFQAMPQGTIDPKGNELNPLGSLYLTMTSASGSKYYDLITDQEIEDNNAQGPYDYSFVELKKQLYVPMFAHLNITKDTFTMTAYRTDTMEVVDQYSMRKAPTNYGTTVLSEKVYVNEPFTMEVRTPVNTQKIQLANANGLPVTLKSATSKVVDDERIWTVTALVGTAGNNRSFTMAMLQPDGTYAVNDTFTIDVLPPVDSVISAGFTGSPASTKVNVPTEVTIVTDKNATGVKIKNAANNADIGRTLVNKTVNSDGTITWKYTIKIGTAGNNRGFYALAGDSKSDPFYINVTLV